MEGNRESDQLQPGYGAGVRRYSLVETIEAFSSEHTEDIDVLLYEWPATKFLALYTAYVKRKVADDLSHRRSLEMAALWGNPNLDQEKEYRPKQMEAIDHSYSLAIARLYDEIDDEEEEIDKDDPFWQAMERGIQKNKLPTE